MTSSTAAGTRACDEYSMFRLAQVRPALVKAAKVCDAMSTADALSHGDRVKSVSGLTRAVIPYTSSIARATRTIVAAVFTTREAPPFGRPTDGQYASDVKVVLTSKYASGMHTGLPDGIPLQVGQLGLQYVGPAIYCACLTTCAGKCATSSCPDAEEPVLTLPVCV